MLTLVGDGHLDYRNGALGSQVAMSVGHLDVDPLGPVFHGSPPIGAFRLSRPLPGLGDDMFVASEDGSEVYVFDANLRHSQTLHGLTLEPLRSFFYDAHGLLASIQDGHGLTTTIERTVDGTPVAVVAPYGQRTELGLDSFGYLASVQASAGRSYAMTNDEFGFILALEDPTGGVSEMAWDQKGRLLVDEDSEGGAMSLIRSELPNGWTVERSTSLGQVTSYSVERQPDGRDLRTQVLPNDLQSTTERNAGSRLSILPDGTEVGIVSTSDPRWGTTTPVESTTTTLPSGLTRTEVRFRTASASEDPLAPAIQEDLSLVNGRPFRSTYFSTDRREVHTTPENRVMEALLDQFGRVIEARSGDSPTLRTVYTGDQVAAIVIDPDTTPESGNERTTQLTYDSAGRLAAVTDPLTNVTAFTDFDAADRPETILLPDASEVTMTYDVMGNVTSVTPPGQAPHDMTYGLHGRIESYTPPVGNTVSYEYDLDRHVDLIDFGLDGFGQPAQVDFVWDSPTGQLLSITSPTGTIDVGYTLGRMTSLVAPSQAGTVTTNLAYDGPLPTSLGWSGPVSGQVNWTYNDRFLIETETIGALASTEVTYGYDNDGLVTQAGAMTITRDAASGRVLTKTVGNLRESYQYTAFGELARQTVERMSGSTTVETLYDAVYDDGGSSGARDALGRITKKTESIVDGDAPISGARSLTSRAYDYGYNPDGRPWLESVAIDGDVVSSYVYDANGNRTAAELDWSQLGYSTAFDASLDDADTDYDTADQVLTYGTREYTWNDFGQLESVLDTATQDETTYSYDLYGNLLGVALPDGRRIEYDVDAAGRRVGRRVLDAQQVELEYRGWVYRDLLRPIAEVDASGHVTARYVYLDGEGSKQNAMHQLATRLGANQDTSLPFAGSNVPEYIELLDGSGDVTQTLRLVVNQVGTVQAVVDVSTGEVVQRLEHDEFGRVLFNSSPGLQPFGFAGGLTDAGTGLVRFGARDYEPNTGRWTARDPVRFGTSPAVVQNLHAFGDTDSINRIDSSGFESSECDELSSRVTCPGGVSADECSRRCYHVDAWCPPRLPHPHGRTSTPGTLYGCKSGLPTFTCSYAYENGDRCTIVEPMGAVVCEVAP